MGCTSSKENTNPPPTTITDNHQALIDDQFRQWLKSNRPRADEYVLNDVISTAKPSTNIDDYRPIVSKALDLLSERSDIKSINKLSKLVQKEVSLASPKKVSHTIDVLQQTADKLHAGQIHFDDNNQPPSPKVTTINGQVSNASENHSISPGESGSALKEALEKARISFYKGKQAAIFANPNGGYDVRIIDENDDALKEDGNLLRSIIVTEVKMRPKSTPSSASSFTSPLSPPPPSVKLLDEREIGDDFRRSIDAALKGLEAIYHTSSVTSSKSTVNEPSISHTDIEPKLVSGIDEMNHSNEIGEAAISSKKEKGRLPHEFPEDIHEIHRKSFHTNGDNLPSTSTNKIPPKPARSIGEHRKTLPESISTPVIMPTETNTTVKSPSHNVTYTEIIQSESRDGEQSRRFITESYDELPTKDDEQTTTLKVVTKSEFSNHPISGEKIMEQTVQVITVKVRNETVKSTNISPALENDLSLEKQSSPIDAKAIDTII